MSHPTIESMESRTLFAAGPTAFVNAVGVLRVHGATGGGNTITVGYNADQTTIEVHIDSTNRLGVSKSFDGTFPLASRPVSSVVVRGGNRADTISIDETSGQPFLLPTRINGLKGNDVITGGSGDDVLVGNLGDDTLDGLGGNDELHGGLGNDTERGGEGDDTIWGGLGDDTLNGEAGNDHLGGILGTNVMIGGAGNDEFKVRAEGQNPDTDFTEGEDTLTVVKKEAKDPAV
jgi:Ca2+-binding RTX toxin-like protein